MDIFALAILIALGTYALEDSPLITAFMRDDINPSVAPTDNEDD